MPTHAPTDESTEQTADRTASGTTTYGPFTMRWIEHGAGRPVLLLHGIYAGAGGHEFDELVTVLEARARVRVPDLLGCASSDHPDLEYSADVVLGAVGALIDDFLASSRPADDDEPPVIVASSLTGAYAVRVLAGRSPRADVRLVLITPTGLGGVQSRTASPLAGAVYAVGRHTPIGDALNLVLTSRASINWFLKNQAYADASKVTDEVVDAHRLAGRRVNAKHAVLAFVTNQLSQPLERDEVLAVRPLVIWGAGQEFARERDRQRWEALGLDLLRSEAGLPQAEEPERVADLVLAAEPIT